MAKSPLSLVDVPARAAVHADPVPGQVRTVLAAVTTWPWSVVVNRGANARSAAAGDAVSASPATAVMRAHETLPTLDVRHSLPRCANRWDTLGCGGTSRCPRRGTERHVPPRQSARNVPKTGVIGTGVTLDRFSGAASGRIG